MSSFDLSNNAWNLQSTASQTSRHSTSGSDMSEMDSSSSAASHDHGSSSADDTCGMLMYINGHTRGFCILFASWTMTSDTALGVACLVCFLIGLAYELLKFCVRYLETTTSVSRPDLQPIPPKAVESGLEETDQLSAPTTTNTDPISWFDPKYFLRCFLYGVQVFYAFMMMLIAMTFNVYIILSLTLGAMVGFYFFGRRDRSSSMSPCLHH
ncbi:copper transpport protein [Dimargaris verticillata]|uniref:Copper transport protein n=1 Tax=Dimargaris verticillata TaxID=2761393 RepID=A0A9W8ECL4_9FUNG|nr:copper transpport protein [Dimargaris verticillata]